MCSRREQEQDELLGHGTHGPNAIAPLKQLPSASYLMLAGFCVPLSALCRPRWAQGHLAAASISRIISQNGSMMLKSSAEHLIRSNPTVWAFDSWAEIRAPPVRVNVQEWARSAVSQHRVTRDPKDVEDLTAALSVVRSLGNNPQPIDLRIEVVADAPADAPAHCGTSPPVSAGASTSESIGSAHRILCLASCPNSAVWHLPITLRLRN